MKLTPELTPEQSALVAEYYGLVINTANRYRRFPGIDFDDLKSACHEAVCQAVVKYDPSFGMTLKNYIICRCRWKCLRLIHGQIRQPSLVTESTVPPVIYDRPFPSLTERVKDLPAYREARPKMRAVVDAYLVDGNYRKVSEKLGFSRQRAEQYLSEFIASAKADLVGV